MSGERNVIRSGHWRTIFDREGGHYVAAGGGGSGRGGSGASLGGRGLATTRDVRIENTQIRGLGGISISLPHGTLIIFANVSNSNGSSLTFNALFTRSRHHCLSSMSPCTQHLVSRINRPSISSVRNLPPTITLRRRHNAPSMHSSINDIAAVSGNLHVLCSQTNGCPTKRSVLCTSTFSPGAPRNTYPAYSNVNHIFRIARSLLIPSGAGAVQRHTVTT